jgi:hypothetical protein
MRCKQLHIYTQLMNTAHLRLHGIIMHALLLLHHVGRGQVNLVLQLLNLLTQAMSCDCVMLSHGFVKTRYRKVGILFENCDSPLQTRNSRAGALACFKYCARPERSSCGCCIGAWE